MQYFGDGINSNNADIFTIVHILGSGKRNLIHVAPNYRTPGPIKALDVLALANAICHVFANNNLLREQCLVLDILIKLQLHTANSKLMTSVR